MKNWYKPGPDPRPPKPKRDWKTDSDVMDYQAKNIEKVRKRLERTKRK